MSVDRLPVLFSFRRCPYAMRARLAIASSQQPCELREVLLRDKPQSLLDASAKGTVPVVVLPDGTVIDESLDIMLWALTQSDPDLWLKPVQGSVDQMLALIAENDTTFKGHLDRYKYPVRYDLDSGLEHRDHAAVWLHTLNERLIRNRRASHALPGKLKKDRFHPEPEAPSNGGRKAPAPGPGLCTASPYLFGERPALADMAIAPFVRQYAHTDRDWFWGQNWSALIDWLDAFLDNPLFLRVMQKYPRWTPDQQAAVLFPPADC